MGYMLCGYDLDDFTRAYLECALWAETDDDENPLDDNHDIDDYCESAVAQAIAICRQFQEEEREILALYDWSSNEGDYAGHNFWLNTHGHGSGFWDEYERVPVEAHRSALSDACDRFNGSIMPFVQDDGTIDFDGC